MSQDLKRHFESAFAVAGLAVVCVRRPPGLCVDFILKQGVEDVASIGSTGDEGVFCDSGQFLGDIFR